MNSGKLYLLSDDLQVMKMHKKGLKRWSRYLDTSVKTPGTSAIYKDDDLRSHHACAYIMREANPRIDDNKGSSAQNLPQGTNNVNISNAGDINNPERPTKSSQPSYAWLLSALTLLCSVHFHGWLRPASWAIR